MDSYREHPGDFDLPSSDTPAADDVATAIGTDERRMHVRAYNYWVSLLDGRDFPSIEDLEPADVVDFEANSVLLDFTCGRDNPAIPYIGGAIREECGLADDARRIDDVPSRSLLSRLTDHYLQIIANRAPIGFEAEFVNQRGENICYRGILMPFSSDGEMIDFIYGVINWKHVEGVCSEADDAGCGDLDPVDDTLPEPPVEREADEPQFIGEITPRLSDEPKTEPAASFDSGELTAAEDVEPAEAAPIHFSWEDGPLNEDDPDALPEIALDADAGLADRLWAARETADAVKAGEGRTRVALYRALSLAYDFAVAARQSPDEYAELLEESGMKVQTRAPMTAIVKLVFGIDYDKARLTEFAAALSYALRQEIGLGAFQDFIEKQPGGLKALVAAERKARRPEPRPDTKGEAARARLRAASSISLAEVPADEEFALVVTRRGADGRHEPVAIIDDESLVERAIRRAV
ncbi:MAG TPA: hypothetical protein VFK19_00805 [Sphingomicrobium sp.]|nr:hypothetical protein [Sphingomicrobium sp.]